MPGRNNSTTINSTCTSLSAANVVISCVQSIAPMTSEGARELMTIYKAMWAILHRCLNLVAENRSM